MDNKERYNRRFSGESVSLIPFGAWVFINDDEFNQGQVVDYDVLNDKYCIDKNGRWEWFDRKTVKILEFKKSGS